MTTWEITNTLALLLMPPGCLLVLSAAGLLLLRSRRTLAGVILAFSWVALYVLSTPLVAHSLLVSLDPTVPDPLSDRTGDAIVILGGGKYYRAPEYGHADTANGSVLERLRYGARLYRTLGKPLLVAGGSPLGDAVPEAEVMKQVLEQDFDVPVRWAEKTSTTTDENARNSFRLVQSAGVKSIYLVTHAWHMRRARASFEHAGFRVIPAPTIYSTPEPRTMIDFLPNAGSLRDTSVYVHEVVGRAWYRLKFALSSRPS